MLTWGSAGSSSRLGCWGALGAVRLKAAAWAALSCRVRAARRQPEHCRELLIKVGRLHMQHRLLTATAPAQAACALSRPALLSCQTKHSSAWLQVALSGMLTHLRLVMVGSAAGFESTQGIARMGEASP